MTITLTTGDILKANAEALVNTVNCVGAMGRGIAAQFKKAYPGNFNVYKEVCDRKELKPGKMLTFKTGRLTNDPKYIINFPTKRHWRGKSRMGDIQVGLDALVEEVRARDIRSIAIPPLGCGLGGLDWNDVRPRIEAAFEALPDVEVILYEPHGAPTPKDMVKAKKTPKMTPGRAVLLGLMQEYLNGLLDPTVSLLEAHKLMYFAQEAGEALRLRYQKAPYGPYADNLRHVFSVIEGHFILGYADGGDIPHKQIELQQVAVEAARALLTQSPATLQRFQRVVELVEGFESPFGMELLSTVHWVSTREGAATDEDTIKAVHEWNERKRDFSPRQIKLARERLLQLGWLSSAA